MAFSLDSSPSELLGWLAPAAPDIYPMESGTPTFWATNPRHIEWILAKDEGIFEKRAVPLELRFLLGDGTAASDYGPHENLWDELRFAKKQVFRSVYPFDSTSKISELLSGKGALCNFEELDIYAWCHDFFFLLNWAISWGMEWSEADLKANQILRETFDWLTQQLTQHTRDSSYFDRSLIEIHRIENRKVSKRQDALRFLLTRLKTGSASDALAFRIGEILEIYTFPKHELVWEFALSGALLASYENSATVAAWCLWLLARSPETQGWVIEALYKGDEKPLEAVVNETLRLYPPVWSIVRQNNASVDFDGQFYEAGSWFFVSPWVQGRSPLGWENPLEFRPQRWLESVPKNGYFLPFGSGSRRCPGETMARMQIVQLLAQLLPVWKIEVSPRRCAPIPVFGITQRPKNGVFLKISRR